MNQKKVDYSFTPSDEDDNLNKGIYFGSNKTNEEISNDGSFFGNSSENENANFDDKINAFPKSSSEEFEFIWEEDLI